jgi:hypothetical protein
MITIDKIKDELKKEEPSYEYYRDNPDSACQDLVFWRNCCEFLLKQMGDLCEKD